MADEHVRIELDHAKIKLVVHETAKDAAEHGANEIQRRARHNAPFKTGMLRESISVVLVEDGEEMIRYEVGSDLDYAKYQEEGTGPIFARPGGVLRFQVGAKIVFTKHTAGVPATHFMRRALEETAAMGLFK